VGEEREPGGEPESPLRGAGLHDRRLVRAGGTAARLGAFAAGTGLPETALLAAALAAQAKYERRVITRAAAGGEWAGFARRGFHRLAARDRAWTLARFGAGREPGR
jgi:hypothetical protein